MKTKCQCGTERELAGTTAICPKCDRATSLADKLAEALLIGVKVELEYYRQKKAESVVVRHRCKYCHLITEEGSTCDLCREVNANLDTDII